MTSPCRSRPGAAAFSKSLSSKRGPQKHRLLDFRPAGGVLQWVQVRSVWGHRFRDAASRLKGGAVSNVIPVLVGVKCKLNEHLSRFTGTV